MTAILPVAVPATGPPWSRLRGRVRWSARADVWLALVCFVLGEVEVVLTDGGATLVMTVSAALATSPIAVRRRAPLAAMIVVAAAWVIFHTWSGVDGEPFFALAALPVIYSLGGHPSLTRSVGGFVVLLVAVAVTDLPDLGFFGFQFAVVWVSGRGVRASRVQSDQLRAVADRLAGERETSERLAVAHERQRVAGELHDTIAHAVSVMVLQAAGAEQMLRREPDRARAALRAVQDSGRSVIAQLQRVLRLLRSTPATHRPDLDSPPAPAPGCCHDHPIARSRWVDPLLALFVVLFADPQLTHVDPVNATPIALSATASVVAIMIRRRLPRAALVISTAATAAGLLIFGAAMGFASVAATMLAMYSVAARLTTRRSLPAAIAAVLAVSVLVLTEVGGVDSAVVVVVWLGTPWFLGRHVRAYRRRAERLRTLTTRLARERDARARLAVLDERARVARELHDSLAHAVNVMVLQAGAAEQVLTSAPERARDAIRAVESQGRQAHDDLRHLLGLLDGDGRSPRAPQPSLTRLDTLLDQARQAGLPVALRVTGQPAPLPADLDVSAYRIVQEALTNTLKHAGPVPTTVALDYRPGVLGIEIRDHGCGRPPPNEENRHGLLGMRERTTLYGGTLTTGPCPDGGFLVEAHLPVDPTAT